MKNINFFRYTIIASILFLIVMFGYEAFSFYIYKTYNATESLEMYLTSNFNIILVLEPILKQSLLTLTILLFGLSVSTNILKLTKIDNKKKWNLFMFTFVILLAIIVCMLVMITYANILLYEITSLLMMALIIIWICVVIVDFIKTKNNNTSIFSRVVIAVLSLIVIVTNTYKVTNDYKVNVSLQSAFDYLIEQKERILLDYGDDEASKELIQKEIDGYKAMKLTLYETSLYSGKSVFALYDRLNIDLFLSSEDRIIQVEDRTIMLENYLYSENHSAKYTINYGLYIGGYSTSIISIAVMIIAVITLKLFPLKRIVEETNSELLEVLELKLADGVITVVEYEALINTINRKGK